MLQGSHNTWCLKFTTYWYLSGTGLHFSWQCKHIPLELHKTLYGLPEQLSGQESACQYRRQVFSPWVMKIPWRRKWQPTSVFWPVKSHLDRGALRVTVHGAAKELDMT